MTCSATCRSSTWSCGAPEPAAAALAEQVDHEVAAGQDVARPGGRRPAHPLLSLLGRSASVRHRRPLAIVAARQAAAVAAGRATCRAPRSPRDAQQPGQHEEHDDVDGHHHEQQRAPRPRTGAGRRRPRAGAGTSRYAAAVATRGGEQQPDQEAAPGADGAQPAEPRGAARRRTIDRADGVRTRCRRATRAGEVSRGVGARTSEHRRHDVDRRDDALDPERPCGCARGRRSRAASGSGR